MSEAILESQPKKETKSATTERARNITQGSNAGVPDFSKLVADHRALFLSDVTRSAEWRESQLIALRSMISVPITTPLQLAPSHGEVRFDPLGVGLIIGTWNYPVMLTLSPLVAAISGGNVAVIKPSEIAAATADVIAQLVP